MTYLWEPTAGVSGRYRDSATGRFVSPSVVRRELDKYLDANDDAFKALAQSLRSRQISLADWELAARRLIKNVHLNAIALERGGWANMRPSDYGRAGQIVREQYGYLRNFGREIAAGTQRLDGTLEWRLGLYGKAGRASFYQSHEANMTAAVTHHGSVRGKRDSCWQCIELDGKVFALNDSSFVMPGRRVCNHNCGCHMRYYRLGAEGSYEVMETA